MYLTVSPDLIAPEGETVVEPSVKYANVYEPATSGVNVNVAEAEVG